MGVRLLQVASVDRALRGAPVRSHCRMQSHRNLLDQRCPVPALQVGTDSFTGLSSKASEAPPLAGRKDRSLPAVLEMPELPGAQVPSGRRSIVFLLTICQVNACAKVRRLENWSGIVPTHPLAA